MTTSNLQKKPAHTDWEPYQVKAELERVGWSLRQLGFHHGYRGGSTLSEVFRRPWPKAEAAIAEALGKKPQQIWPSRYDKAGNPIRPHMGRKPMRPSHINEKPTTAASAGNPQKAVA